MIRTANYLIDGAIGALGFALVAIGFAICFAGLIVYLVARYKLFKKCGEEGWIAFIPLYGSYVFMTRICGLHWGWFVAYIAVTGISLEATAVSALRLFVNAMSFYNLGIRCNRDKTAAMIFGAIAPAVVTVIYGIGNIEYHKDIEVKQSGLF